MSKDEGSARDPGGEIHVNWYIGWIEFIFFISFPALLEGKLWSTVKMRKVFF